MADLASPALTLRPRFFRSAASVLQCLIAALAGTPSSASAQQAPAAKQPTVLGREDYVRPPAVIAEVLEGRALYSLTRLGTVGPDSDSVLVGRSGGMPGLDVLARPYRNLGEVALDLVAGRSRRTTLGNTVGYDVFSVRAGERRRVELPAGMTVSGGTWAPDGGRFAFLGHTASASYIYLVDVREGQASPARRLSERPALASLTGSLRFTADGSALFAVLQPEGRESMPTRSDVAQEPRIFTSVAGKTPGRTYRFLLKTPHDKALLEWGCTGQLARIEVDGGAVEAVGAPSMIRSFDPSPDGEYVRVTTVQKPFSYLAPMSAFGTKDELWNRAGEIVQEIGKRPLRLGRSQTAPKAAAAGAKVKDAKPKPEPKRSLAWRPDGTGLSFMQKAPKAAKAPGKNAPPKKDRAKKDRAKKTTKGSKAAQAKDRVMLWRAPFGDDDVKVVFESSEPIQSVRYDEACKTLFITRTEKGMSHFFAVRTGQPDRLMTIRRQKVEASRSRRLSGGGRPSLLTKMGSAGRRVVRVSTDGRSVYYSGVDYADDPMKTAPRPYLEAVIFDPEQKKATAQKTDAQKIKAQKTKDAKKVSASPESKRLWQSSESWYEVPAFVLDDDLQRVVISRESSTKVPQSWLIERTDDAVEERRLTDNADPCPQVTGARRLRLRIKRVDGFEFWASVTIPSDYGEKLPALFWFYPREFSSQKAYDERQKRYNKYRFPMPRTRSMELMTLLGYVVVQPDCPIVGPEGRMNDNYVHDLRNSLWAVIDELDKRNIIDRDRLAIGGHSYGAFGTANAMVHTPFFKAGIAGDGNYNRTLTPMGFQAERRHLWAARENYLRMSPLLWANQLQGALLMYHGIDDTNTGTFPIHSPRMFQVLNGIGRDTALYMYPYEGHGPMARETILDLWARWSSWLDTHVKYHGRERPASGRVDAAVGESGPSWR